MGTFICLSLKSLISRNIHRLPRTCFHSSKFHTLCRLDVRTKINPNVQTRTFFKIFKRPTKQQLREKDNPPEKYELIYRNTMDRYLRMSQIITVSTAVIVSLTVLVNYEFSSGSLPFSEELALRPRETENELMIYLGAFYTVIIVLQLYLRRMPIRIYNHPQQGKYLMIFYGYLPNTYTRVACKVGEISKLPETGLLPWRQGKYEIKDGPELILMDQYFRRSADLNIMLGWQKHPDAEDAENED